MSKIKARNYVPEVCMFCHQTTTYLISIDRGTADIVRAIAVAIHRKGINVIHPRKEMESKNPDPLNGTLSSNQVGNLTHARVHGLIAKMDGNAGNYLLTSKGKNFLKGYSVPRYAICSKSENRQIGYFEEVNCRITIRDLIEEDEYWQLPNFEIVAGHIVNKIPDTDQTLPI